MSPRVSHQVDEEGKAKEARDDECQADRHQSSLVTCNFSLPRYLRETRLQSVAWTFEVASKVANYQREAAPPGKEFASVCP